MTDRFDRATPGHAHALERLRDDRIAWLTTVTYDVPIRITPTRVVVGG